MSNVLFTADVRNAIINISYQLERMNDLKEKELYLKYGVKGDVDV